MFNSEVEEQLHLNFDSNKNFLNIMTLITTFIYFDQL